MVLLPENAYSTLSVESHLGRSAEQLESYFPHLLMPCLSSYTYS